MRSLLRIVSAIGVTVCLLAGTPVIGQVSPPRRRLLVIGEEKGYRHEAVTHAMVTIERLGKETGLWDTVIRTDTEALTKSKLEYNVCYILNHMVQYTRTVFDASFAALSDATRRGVLEQLRRADASITDLAKKFH